MSDKLNKKCELIESLGFEIDHVDSRVTMAGHEFDFSATQPEAWAIVQTAVLKSFELGKKKEKEELVNKARVFLNINS